MTSTKLFALYVPSLLRWQAPWRFGCIGWGSGSSQHSFWTAFLYKPSQVWPAGRAGGKNTMQFSGLGTHTFTFWSQVRFGPKPTFWHYGALFCFFLSFSIFAEHFLCRDPKISRRRAAGASGLEPVSSILGVLSFPSHSKEPATLKGHFGRKRERKSRKVGIGSRTDDLRH